MKDDIRAAISVKKMPSEILELDNEEDLEPTEFYNSVQFKPEPEPAYDAIHLEDAIGDPEYKAVEDDEIHLYPWSNICRLKIKYEGSSVIWGGTGFLIHNRVIATAAHNVLHPEQGKMSQIEILRPVPGGFTKLNLRNTRKDYRKPDNWGKRFVSNEKKWNPIYDYAALIIDPVDRGAGFIQIGNHGDAWLEENSKINLLVSGYPAKRKPKDSENFEFKLGKQYFSKGNFNREGSAIINYFADTTGGISGGPLLVNYDGKAYGAMAIHVRGFPDRNVAKVIGGQCYADFKSWVNEFTMVG